MIKLISSRVDKIVSFLTEYGFEETGCIIDNALQYCATSSDLKEYRCPEGRHILAVTGDMHAMC